MPPMKITRIDVFRVDYELVERVYAWSRGQAVKTMESTVVKVSTDEGIVGWVDGGLPVERAGIAQEIGRAHV